MIVEEWPVQFLKRLFLCSVEEKSHASLEQHEKMRKKLLFIMLDFRNTAGLHWLPGIFLELSLNGQSCWFQQASVFIRLISL